MRSRRIWLKLFHPTINMYKMSNLFANDISFCSGCGAILPSIPEAGNIVCLACQAEVKLDIFESTETSYSVVFNKRENLKVKSKKLTKIMKSWWTNCGQKMPQMWIWENVLCCFATQICRWRPNRVFYLFKMQIQRKWKLLNHWFKKFLSIRKQFKRLLYVCEIK